MRRVLIVLSCLVVLVGCAGGPKPTDDNPRGSNASASAEPTEEPTGEADGPGSFGQPLEYADGLAVTVGKPQPYAPDEYSQVEGAGGYVKLPIRIVNGTDDSFDPSLFITTVQSGNEEAEELYVSDIRARPETSILSGRESEFDVVYAVKNPSDLVVDVSPDANASYDTFTVTS